MIGSSAVEMQVFSNERDTLLVDLKKVSMNTSLSLREHLVFMELARQDMVPLAETLTITLLILSQDNSIVKCVSVYMVWQVLFSSADPCWL